MGTAARILAAVAAMALVLLFVVILILATRPALLLGVDGDSLANSLAGHPDEPACRKRDDGDWHCYQLKDVPPHYRVSVNWMGCWKATRLYPRPASGEPKTTDGCIELGDIITLD